MIKQAISHFLSGYVFKSSDVDQIDFVAARCQYLYVAKGCSVFERGDDPKGLYVIVRGQLKLGVTSLQGLEKIINIIGPGDFFGEATLFLERRYPFYAQATIDSEVLLIPKSTFFSQLDEDAYMGRKMLADLSVKTHRMLQDIEMLSLQSSTQRFIGYTQTTAGNALTLPASKTMIASLLNISPETLSRTMAKLHHSGFIELKGKEVRITNLEKLRSYEMN